MLSYHVSTSSIHNSIHLFSFFLVQGISPYAFANFGVAASIGLSIVGAAWFVLLPLSAHFQIGIDVSLLMFPLFCLIQGHSVDRRFVVGRFRQVASYSFQELDQVPLLRKFLFHLCFFVSIRTLCYRFCGMFSNPHNFLSLSVLFSARPSQFTV
jgi:hypothetical protein